MVDYREDYQAAHRPARDRWATPYEGGHRSSGIWVAIAAVVGIVVLALLFAAGTSSPPVPDSDPRSGQTDMTATPAAPELDAPALAEPVSPNAAPAD